jgi:DUF1680 family protein
MRIPAWAGSKTALAINGRRADAAVEPGKFLALHRTWKDGDRVELELEMPPRLEAIDAQNPNTVALISGPIALFMVGNIPAGVTRKHLLAANPLAKSSDDWVTQTHQGPLALRPFASIMSEDYRLYLRVES